MDSTELGENVQENQPSTDSISGNHRQAGMFIFFLLSSPPPPPIMYLNFKRRDKSIQARQGSGSKAQCAVHGSLVLRYMLS